MLIGISGMIASGKSSLSEKLHKNFSSSELLHEFEDDDVVFNTFLKWLYEKKENISIGFQAYILENHASKLQQILKQLKQQNQDDLIFLDRFSLEHHLFAQILLKDKPLNYWKAYEAIFENIITRNELPDFAIFLDISFETFKKRIFQRGREAEIDNWEENYEYFKTLHSLYFESFSNMCKKYNLEYAVIDTNNLTEDQVLKEALRIIQTKINKEH
ncbi:deoxynucleoside kinase [Mycoplasma phocoenae]|uniref:Deoxynucleoside kinase n=1 Tax=Mycoplasma phocoenae TaxID=754517 RepID=A0A858U6Y3_9MOLU|nr:deoxynucleoside kinase [Mycoplasma phocoenae]QJG67025.1 deoxynucleoside kinase [Mycoplasma phocoenae]